MPRAARKAPGGRVFHVLNRGVGRQTIFEKDEDYAAFERVMAHALAADPVQLLAFCLMPNHWHLLLKPQSDGQLGRFVQFADDDPRSPLPAITTTKGITAA